MSSTTSPRCGVTAAGPRARDERDSPDDFVIATGISHSVGDLVKVAFEHADLDWHKHMTLDPTSSTERKKKEKDACTETTGPGSGYARGRLNAAYGACCRGTAKCVRKKRQSGIA
jgi:hypothetical protein